MKKSRIIRNVSILILIGFGIILLGLFVFTSKKEAFIAAGLTVIALFAVTVVFEASSLQARKLSVTSVMTALSVLGRIIFYPIPFFKPVSAVIILCGIHLGPLCGAISGALSALVSGMFFGLGLWTPFQMLAWGLVGFISGVASKILRKSMFSLSVWGALSGVLFSLVMDVFTVLGFGEGATLRMYAAAVLTAVPITVVYAVSNIVFLAVLARPVGKKLERITG